MPNATHVDDGIGGASSSAVRDWVIDETRFFAPLSLTTEYFDSWPTPVPDSTLPLAQPPPRPMFVKSAQVLKEPLPNDTILEFRYANTDNTAWDWYLGKVVNWRRRSDNGIEHEIEWLDKRWLKNDWINLASSVRIWRLTLSPTPIGTTPSHATSSPAPAKSPPPPAPSSLPAAPRAPPAAPRATRSSTRAAALHRTRAVQSKALLVNDTTEDDVFIASLRKQGLCFEKSKPVV